MNETLQNFLAWEMLWPIGVVVLALALAWGLYRDRTRNKANDRVTEAATRELYKDPEHYDEKRRELKKQIRPS